MLVAHSVCRQIPLLGRPIPLLARPNKAGLNVQFCPPVTVHPSICMSTRSFSDFNKIWYVNRGWWVIHDGMLYDLIQGQVYGGLKYLKMADFKACLLCWYHHHHSSLFGMHHQCVAPLATNSLHSGLFSASSIASSKVRLCRARSFFRVAIQEV